MPEPPPEGGRAQPPSPLAAPRRAPAVSGLRRAIYLLLAAITFALGALGAILPGLPTTPFLLLCSYFLVRSSPRLNERLLRSRLFGPILRDWQERGGVRRDVKIRAIVIVIPVAGAAVIYSPLPFAARASIAAAVAIGITVILFVPEIPKELERVESDDSEAESPRPLGR